MNWEQLLDGSRRRPGGARYKSEYDNRTEFEKDYHRIIGSASFRRLQDKTQVFPLDQSDFVRTRLTHSLEVSSIAKSLGQSVCYKLLAQGRITREQQGPIEDILLCAGLLHDIGNPPFGHYGETVIRKWFKNNLSRLQMADRTLEDWLLAAGPQMAGQLQRDLCCFEGNAQSLRVVSKLHYLIDENGMNLTKAAMNTIIKYPVPSVLMQAEPDIRYKKMGYFYADTDVFREITEGTGAGSCRYPLTFLLEAADDIAYSTADLEDGLKKDILHYHQLLYLLEHNRFREAGGQGSSYCVEAAEKLKELFAWAVSKKESCPELYAVQNWIIYLQGRLIYTAVYSFISNYDKIMAGTYDKDLFAGTDGEGLIKMLKDIALNHVFNTKSIIKLEIAADTILNFLLDHFAAAAVYYDTGGEKNEKHAKIMDLVSDNYKKIYKISSKGKSEGEKLYLRMLLITDFISGMTDHYAKTLYQDLNGIY